MEEILMTSGNIKKNILMFSIPLFIGNLFQQFYTTADSLIVGNFLGNEALAAISSTGSFVYLVIGFCQGFADGAGVIVANSIGAKDHERTEKAVHTAVAIGLVLSLVIMLFALVGVEPVLRLMDTPENVMTESVTYLTIYFLGGLPLVMYNMFVGILQAKGDSKHPLYYLIASSIINVILDILFVGPFRMGVAGAAIATVISEMVSMILVMIRLWKTQDDTHLSIAKVSFDKKSVKEIIRFGIPIAFQNCIVDLSNILIQSYINNFGSNAIAGIGAASKVEGFAFLPVSTLGMAATTFISQNMGAKEYDRIKEGRKFLLWITLLLNGCLGICLYMLAPAILCAFSSDPDVLAYGVRRMHTVTLFYFLVGYSNVSGSVVCGLGKPNVATIILITCWCAVRVLVLFTIGQIVHDIYLVYWIYPVTWLLSAVAYFIYFRIHNLNTGIPEQNRVL